MTTDLGPALREISEVADSRLLAPASAVRARGDQRRRRTVLGASAAVGLATAGIVLAVGSIRAAPQSAPPLGAGPTQPSNSATYPFSKPLGPERSYRISPKGEGFRPLAIAANESTFVVSGAGSPSPLGASMYWSEDGATWQAVTGLGSDARVADVIHTDDGFIGVGSDGQGPNVWRSEDGRTWSVATIPPRSGAAHETLFSLTVTSLGYFTWGRGLDGSWLVWRSTDGHTWTPIAHPEVFALPGDETICSIRDGQNGLSASELVSPHGVPDEVQKVVWESDDGETWTRVDSSPSAHGCGHDEVIDHSRADSAAGAAAIFPDPGADKVYLRAASR